MGDYSLLAMGKSGPWEINLDGENVWPRSLTRLLSLVIHGQNIYMDLLLDNEEQLEKALKFMTELDRKKPYGEDWEFALGRFGNGKVTLILDNEFDDRMFLHISGVVGVIRYTFAGDDFYSFVACLRELIVDLRK